jgi:hypothetical protein
LPGVNIVYPDMSINKYLPLEYRECYNGSYIALDGLSMEKRKKFYDWVCALDDDTFAKLADVFNSDDIKNAFIRCNISGIEERFVTPLRVPRPSGDLGDVLISDGMMKELRFLMVWFTINERDSVHQFIIDDVEIYDSIPLWLQLSVFNFSYSARVVSRMEICKRGPIYYGDLNNRNADFNDYSYICCCKYCLECFMVVREFQLPISDVTKNIQMLYFKCKEYL